MSRESSAFIDELIYEWITKREALLSKHLSQAHFLLCHVMPSTMTTLQENVTRC